MAGNPNWKRGAASPNPRGRPKESKRQELLTIVTDLCFDSLDLIKTDIKELKPRERVQLISNLLGFVLPRQRAIEFTESSSLEEFLNLDEHAL
ncbi:MAG: hypothetical protein O7A68_05245 [Alphaproteobacteria bacterium]|nr:hypothetical protein [Alphaproteobacteria bacterium]